MALQEDIDLLLDTDTMVVASQVRADRILSLHQGQVAVTVSGNQSACSIAAAGHTLLCTQGEFNVRLTDQTLIACVMSGTLLWNPGQISAAPQRVLRSGDRICLGRGAPPTIDRPCIDDVTAWQTGRLAFRNTPLVQAIAEMNRYSKTKMELATNGTANLVISGYYHAGNTQGFIEALQTLLPVRAKVGKTILIMKV